MTIEDIIFAVWKLVWV